MHVLYARARPNLEPVQDDALLLRREIRAELIGRRQLASVDNTVQRFCRGHAGGQAIDRRAERVYIRPRALLAVGSIMLLRRKAVLYVDGVGVLAHRRKLPRRAKVQQRQRSVRADHDVIGADVPVQKMMIVHAYERLDQRLEELQYLG